MHSANFTAFSRLVGACVLAALLTPAELAPLLAPAVLAPLPALPALLAVPVGVFEPPQPAPTSAIKATRTRATSGRCFLIMFAP
jgi:hypothetical protein